LEFSSHPSSLLVPSGQTPKTTHLDWNNDYPSRGRVGVESIERARNELRSRMKHIRKLQVLHIIGAVFFILVLIFASPHGGRGGPVVAGLMVCLFLVIWIIARLVNLIAEYERTVTKLKMFEFFPATYESYGSDVPDEIEEPMSLDAYKLNGRD
jgi:hypothetical protein